MDIGIFTDIFFLDCICITTPLMMCYDRWTPGSSCDVMSLPELIQVSKVLHQNLQNRYQ